MIQYLVYFYVRSTVLNAFSKFQVVLYNRGDCCSERLSNAQVTIGNTPNGKGNAVCGNAGVSTGKERIEVICAKKLEGRYVTVTVPNNILTLCEVEVMGTPPSKQNYVICTLNLGRPQSMQSIMCYSKVTLSLC